MRFEGTAAYVADKDLMVAVNAAIALERPLQPNEPTAEPRAAAREEPADADEAEQHARPH